MIYNYDTRKQTILVDIKKHEAEMASKKIAINAAQEIISKAEVEHARVYAEFKETNLVKTGAQKQINEALIKKTYSLFSKGRSGAVESLIELFVSILRCRRKSTAEDVEHYLKKFEGVIVAMTKIDTSKLKGDIAKDYSDSLTVLRETHFDMTK
jgi:hypothetical protein